MPVFAIVAKDREGAEESRATARAAHMVLADNLIASRNILFGAAILNETQISCGSVLICQFEKRADLDKYLSEEPYASSVWDALEVFEIRVGPQFQSITHAAPSRSS